MTLYVETYIEWGKVRRKPMMRGMYKIVKKEGKYIASEKVIDLHWYSLKQILKNVESFHPCC